MPTRRPPRRSRGWITAARMPASAPRWRGEAARSVSRRGERGGGQHGSGAPLEAAAFDDLVTLRLARVEERLVRRRGRCRTHLPVAPALVALAQANVDASLVVH